MRKIFLDIETLPAGEDKLEILQKLYDKKVAKQGGEKSEGETFEAFVGATNFDGAFGRILCIGFAIDDGAPETLYHENDERQTLKRFWEIVDSISSPSRGGYGGPDYGVQFVGHNVMDFDLRFIYQRSIVLDVKPAYELNFARYRSYPIFDTMREWSKWSSGMIGLEKLALALGVPSPKDEGIDGSQVAQFFADGKVNDILEYCKRDVQTTRDVYRKMTFDKPANKLF